MITQTHHYALIMAGGIGSRFWPISTTEHPKQFQDLTGEGASLLQQTYDRLSGLIPDENIWVLTNDAYQSQVLAQLPAVPPQQIIAEPARRNTAPCLLLAALKIQKIDPNAQLLVLPSDHFIDDRQHFQDDVTQAFAHSAVSKELITFGIQPNSPHTGYGYIAAADKKAPISSVLRFEEKPSVAKATSFLEAGNYCWNAGIFVWSVDTLIDAFERFSPQMFALMTKERDVLNTPKESAFLRENYPKAEDISIDYAILEKADNVAVLRARFSWNDLGSWSALHQQLGDSPLANVSINTDVLADNAKGNLIYSSAQQKVIVKDVDDLIVVLTDNQVMILPKKADQSVKQLQQMIENTKKEKD